MVKNRFNVSNPGRAIAAFSILSAIQHGHAVEQSPDTPSWSVVSRNRQPVRMKKRQALTTKGFSASSSRR